jgi:hypothetical protein
MKSGSPVKAWMRLAGEATIGGAMAAEAGRATSGLPESLPRVSSLIAHLKKTPVRAIIEQTADNRN